MQAQNRNSWHELGARGGGVEWAVAAFADLRFSPHRHDTYALGFTTHGVQRFSYRGATWHCRPGDVFVLHPDELHDGGPGTEAGFGYRIVYVAPDRIAEALGRADLPFRPEPVSRAAWLRREIASAFPHAGDPADALHETDAVCTLADALARAAGGPVQAAAAIDPEIHRLRERLAGECARGLDMGELERAHGMGRYEIARQFRRAFGTSPSRFVTLRRLDLARQGIADGQSLAAAALAAGFCDQSHMSRHFRAAFGLTPGRWRELRCGHA